MTALTEERPISRRRGTDFEYPVAAATKILRGALACINASSVVVNGAVSTTLKCVGVAKETADNTAGAAGAIAVKVERGCFPFANSASGDLIALKDIGADCYIVDNQTVALTSGGSTRSVAGKIRDVNAEGVWVEI